LSAARVKARELRIKIENKSETSRVTFEEALEAYYVTLR